MARRCSRRKAVVVPVSFADSTPRYLVVRDRLSKEWGFVSGGCRAAEDFEDGAGRELTEETRGAMGAVDINNPLHFDMHSRVPVPVRGAAEPRLVHTHHRVFVFVTRADSGAIARTFHQKTPRTRAEAETDDVAMVTLDEMRHLKLWNEARDRIMFNPMLHGTVRAVADRERVRQEDCAMFVPAAR